MPDYPSDFLYHPINKSVTWDYVPEATEYNIQMQPNAASPFVDIYTGTNKECGFDQPVGSYPIKGRIKRKDEWLQFGPPETVSIPPENEVPPSAE